MPQYVHTNNSSFAIPYNGSWAHLSYFLNAGHTTRKWVRDGGFDILHLHEPETPGHTRERYGLSGWEHWRGLSDIRA